MVSVKTQSHSSISWIKKFAVKVIPEDLVSHLCIRIKHVSLRLISIRIFISSIDVIWTRIDLIKLFVILWQTPGLKLTGWSLLSTMSKVFHEASKNIPISSDFSSADKMLVSRLRHGTQFKSGHQQIYINS